MFYELRLKGLKRVDDQLAPKAETLDSIGEVFGLSWALTIARKLSEQYRAGKANAWVVVVDPCGLEML